MTLRLQGRVHLPAEPDRVWGILTDWEGQAAWMPDVASIRVIGPERGLGAELAVLTRVFGIPIATDRVRVTGWDPPRSIRVDHEGLVMGTGEWRLDPAAGGGTRFTWAEELRMPPPILGGVALWLYGPWQRWMLHRSLRNLAKVVEAATRGP